MLHFCVFSIESASFLATSELLMSFSMLAFTLLILGLCRLHIAQSVSNITDEKVPNTIYLDKPGDKSFFYNPAPEFYFAYQPTPKFVLTTVSPTFIKVPGLALVFCNAHPRIFRISIQGQMHTSALTFGSMVKVMIDEHILISNKLVPNTEERFKLLATPGSDLWSSDWAGGILAYSASSFITISAHKSETVYLPAGTHSINVAARTSKTVSVEGFELSVEVNDIPEGAKINLPLLVPMAG